MTIPFSEIGLAYICPNCGYESNIQPMERSRLLEQFVAKGLEASILPERFPNIDVFKSDLLPDLTFQVKGCWKPIMHSSHYGSFWRFYERGEVEANWYLCFGALDSQFHLFAFPKRLWQKHRKLGRKERDPQFYVQFPVTPLYNIWAWHYEITNWPEQFLRMAKGRHQLELGLADI